MSETYYYGQGRVSLALRDASTGAVGAYAWIGDVSAFTLKYTSDKVEHKESYSGQRGLVRSFPVGASMEIDMTLHQFDSTNLARILRSTVQSTSTGTATAEALGDTDTAVGDVLYLAHPGVSDVVVTDSTGTPLTLTAGTDYDLDANFGRVTIKNVTGYVLPLKVAYSYKANSAVGMLTQGQSNYALKYEGLNLAEGNAPVIVDIFKLAPDIVQQLDLITSGNDVAPLSVTGAGLLDSSKSSSGVLGQFGSITQVASA
jgi:hypothetical protein